MRAQSSAHTSSTNDVIISFLPTKHASRTILVHLSSLGERSLVGYYFLVAVVKKVKGVAWWVVVDLKVRGAADREIVELKSDTLELPSDPMT